MKVKDLIQFLATQDPELEVVLKNSGTRSDYFPPMTLQIAYPSYGCPVGINTFQDGTKVLSEVILSQSPNELPVNSRNMDDWEFNEPLVDYMFSTYHDSLNPSRELTDNDVQSVLDCSLFQKFVVLDMSK